MNPADDAPHDAYLKQALRHAPDADVTAPPQLSEAILRAARGAAAPQSVPARASTATSALQALWIWFAQPRVATGFASLMVATLAGVMWWGQPIAPGLDSPAEPPLHPPAAPIRDIAATLPAQAAAPTPAPTASPVAQASAKAALEAGPSESLLKESRDSVARPAGAPAPDRSDASPSARSPLEARARAPSVFAESPAQQESAAPEPLKRRVEAAAVPAADAEASADAAAASGGAPAIAMAPRAELAASGPSATIAKAAASPLPSPAAADHAAALPATASQANAAAPVAAAETGGGPRRDLEMRSLAPEKTSTARAAAATGLGVQAPPMPELALGLAAARGSALSRLHADIAAAPARWQWRWNDGEPRAADAALLDWLARVNRASSTGRARAAGATAKSPVADTPEADTALTQTLMLLLDGKPHRMVQFGTGRVRLTAVEDRVPLQDATLAPAAVDDLQRSIDALGR